VLQWGGENYKPSSASEFGVIGNWNEGIITQTRTSTKLFSTGKTFIQRFDNMTLLPQFNKQIILETARGKKVLEYQVLQRLGDFPVLFATNYNREKDKIELYGRTYDLEGEPLGREKKIAEFTATRKSQMEGLNFVQSADSSSMLAFFSERFDQYEKEKIEFKLFNKALDLVWNRNIEFPYKGKNFSIHRSIVDKSGRVYLLVRISNDLESKNQRDAPVFRYGLVTFAEDTSLIEDYEITLNNKFISDIDFVLDDSSNVICSGFYSNRGLKSAAGTFYVKIDRAGKRIGEKIMSEFDPEFAEDFIENSKIRGKLELSDFKLDHLVQFTDGSIALVAEQFLIDQICYQDFRTGMMTCNYLYYYNNIIVVKIDTNGQPQWTANIPKYQESNNDYGFYSSYAFATLNNQLYFVFNDHEKNVSGSSKNQVLPMSNISKAVPVLVRIGADGSFLRRSLTNDRKSRMIFTPRYSRQISDKSMMLFAMSSNKYKIGIVGLE
jgi:hypothetical protein